MSLIILSYFADLLFGDPQGFPHPVRFIGRLIIFLEKLLRKKRKRLSKGIVKLQGILLTVLVIAISSFCSFIFIFLMGKINQYLGYAAWIFIGYTALSVKDLHVKVNYILKGLRKGDLPEARKQLSFIVGRDTENLGKEDIVRAVIECVSESTCDGIIAPLFYMILGGPVLAIAYKSINTLDSMVGYKNKVYKDFGWFSAKLDDIANYIPARITGILISVSAAFFCKNTIKAFRTMNKDGRKHPSPNSGISEAAMAGAIGVRLGGESSYQGVLFEKPYIGESLTDITVERVAEALKISFTASVIMVLIGGLVKCII